MSAHMLFVVRHKESGAVFPESAAADSASCIRRFCAIDGNGKYLTEGWKAAEADGYERVQAYLGPVYGLEEVVKFLDMGAPGTMFTAARLPDGVKVLGIQNGGDADPMAMTRLLQPLQHSLSAAFKNRERDGYRT